MSAQFPVTEDHFLYMCCKLANYFSKEHKETDVDQPECATACLLTSWQMMTGVLCTRKVANPQQRRRTGAARPRERRALLSHRSMYAIVFLVLVKRYFGFLTQTMVLFVVLRLQRFTNSTFVRQFLHWSILLKTWNLVNFNHDGKLFTL